MNKNVSDGLSLFRQSATLMAAGILLAAIGKPGQLLVIAGLLLLTSIPFLIAGVAQIFPRCKGFVNWMRTIGDNLTLDFIIVSTISIVQNWSGIKGALSRGNGIDLSAIPWLNDVLQWVIWYDLPIWLIFVLWIVLGAYIVIEICKILYSLYRTYGARKSLLLLLLAVLYVGSIYGIVYFSNWSSTFNRILFFISVSLTVVFLLAITKYMNRLRRLRMDDKEKARASAISVSAVAALIGNLLTLNYPQENLKVVLNVPLKQLEDELEDLKAYIKALK